MLNKSFSRMNLFNKKPSQNYTLKSFFKAVKEDNENEVKEILKSCPYFIDAKIDEYMTPLKTAAACGNLNIVKLLVEKGAEVYSNPMASYPAVMDAAWNKQEHVVNYFLHEIPKKAIGTNDLGVTINLASRQGWTEIVKKHIERDPLAVHQRGWIGDTPLHWSSHNGFEDIVILLIDKGADIEADEINWIGGKPLHWASEHAPNTTKILLEHGAQVNSRNEKEGSPCYGRTPLIHNATQREDCSEITEMLLKAGADLHAVDAEGKTALQWAKERKNTKIESILKSA
jgi:ankyrin repeat protein